MDGGLPESRRRRRADDDRRQAHFDSPGTDPDPRRIWELPAGQIDDAGDDEVSRAQTVALRELREETGYELADDGELISLGDFFSSPGFTDERGYFFLARPVDWEPRARRTPKAESILDCRAFTPHEFAPMIETNDIRDANTLAVCARLLASRSALIARIRISHGPAQFF